jgi:proteasome lid subunit RPN8/RPN11
MKHLEERVGFITNDGEVVEVKNIHHTPDLAFDVDPKVMIAYEDKICATWHTHPITTSHLSSEDYVGFQMWPELLHLIVGTDGVAGYVIRNRAVVTDASKDHPAWVFEDRLASWL